jgi:hypothetical protein
MALRVQTVITQSAAFKTRVNARLHFASQYAYEVYTALAEALGDFKDHGAWLNIEEEKLPLTA